MGSSVSQRHRLGVDNSKRYGWTQNMGSRQLPLWREGVCVCARARVCVCVCVGVCARVCGKCICVNVLVHVSMADVCTHCLFVCLLFAVLATTTSKVIRTGTAL